MNWSAVSALVGILGIVVTVLGVSFVAGKIVGKITEHTAQIAENTAAREEHAVLLGEHTIQIDRLEQWRSGYNAAANVSGVAKV